ncbi:hypothetical protein AMK18_32640 [Streptomyces sp. CB01249]|nr:hypothetical protein AMK18_32640 [Streptomyces sp. CB01249]
MTGNGSGVHPHEEPEVGRNLRDHPTVNMVFAHSPVIAIAERAADLIRGRAPMRSTDSAEDVDLRPARSS